MKTWKGKTSFLARCEDCGKDFTDHNRGQEEARKHAKKYKHIVRGEIVFAVHYNGK